MKVRKAIFPEENDQTEHTLEFNGDLMLKSEEEMEKILDCLEDYDDPNLLFNQVNEVLLSQRDEEELGVVKPKVRIRKKKPFRASKVQLSVRTTPRHYVKMFEFFEANPGLATGQLAKACYRKKWRELTALLNAEGLGEKSTEKWQKTWSDYKLNLRKKISAMKQQDLITQSGNSVFTEQEERALALVGLSLDENSTIQALQKRFSSCGAESSEDSSSQERSLTQLKRQRHKFRLRNHPWKISRELRLIRQSLDVNLRKISNKFEEQNCLVSQLTRAAEALALTASNLAGMLKINN